MFKITVVVSLILIATWSQADSRRNKKEESSENYNTGNLLAAGLSCDSCGRECASACGTRHFRSCCFNYLRKKRGPETMKFLPEDLHDLKSEKFQRPAPPIFVVEEVPEQWINNILSNEYKPYTIEDTVDNRLHALYDV